MTSSFNGGETATISFWMAWMNAYFHAFG